MLTRVAETKIDIDLQLMGFVNTLAICDLEKPYLSFSLLDLFCST